MTLKLAYNLGVNAAYQRYKLAGPMGADVKVAPKGPNEWSHGTDTTQYPTHYGDGADPHHPAAAALADNNVDFLWNISDIDRMAPGATAGFGTETIG